MKLPPDYQIISLGALHEDLITTPKKIDETLEMTKEQYLRYKELVWREDPIRFYNGMEIVVEKKDTEPAGSLERAVAEVLAEPIVLSPEDDGPNAPGNLL